MLTSIHLWIIIRLVSFIIYNIILSLPDEMKIDGDENAFIQDYTLFIYGLIIIHSIPLFHSIPFWVVCLQLSHAARAFARRTRLFRALK